MQPEVPWQRPIINRARDSQHKDLRDPGEANIDGLFTSADILEEAVYNGLARVSVDPGCRKLPHNISIAKQLRLQTRAFTSFAQLAP